MAKTTTPDQYLQMYYKVKSEKGLIKPGENVFFSIFLIDEMESNWHKLLEYIQKDRKNNLKKFSEKIADCDVYVLDAMIFKKLSEASISSTEKKNFDPSTYKYWEEYTEATKLGKRIIDFTDWNKIFHQDLTKIDEKMYANLKEMLASNEDAALEVAVSIISSTNREDDTTVKYLKDLTKIVNDSKLKSSIEFRELVSFLSKAYED